MSDFDGNLFGEEQMCFGCGPKHPNGFHLQLSEESDASAAVDGIAVVTRFTPRDTDQGPPGVMHGGLVLTLVDELAAWCVIARMGKFGFTARVSAKLLRPTRIGLEVVGRAKLVRKTSRIAEVSVSLTQAGIETCQGELTFALLDRAAAEKLTGRSLPPEWSRFGR